MIKVNTNDTCKAKLFKLLQKVLYLYLVAINIIFTPALVIITLSLYKYKAAKKT